MLSLLIIQLTFGQAAEVRTPVAVVITSKRPGAEADAPKVAQRVFDSFKREGVGGLLDDATASQELRLAGFSDPKACQGTRACLSKLAILLGPKAVVVGVDVGKVGQTIAIHLEAVAADREQSLGSLDVSSLLSGWSDAMSVPIVVFVREVKAGLDQGKATVPVDSRSDAPKRTELTPTATQHPMPGGGDEDPGKPPRFAAWIFAGSAVATAGVAVGLGVVSANARSQFNGALIDLGGGTRGSRLPEDQARALANSANTNGAVAVTAGIASAALTVAAAFYFLNNGGQ